MKKSDIAMIIFIASLSTLAAYFVANAFVGDIVNEPVQVKTIEAISSSVPDPNKDVFNSDAINPTVEVIIGSSNSSVEISNLSQ